MRATLILAACALASTLGAARAQDTKGPFDGAELVTAQDMESNRGGTDSQYLSNNVFQENDTSQTGTNQGNVSVGYGGVKTAGTISAATISGNHGISALMQNTGDLVNMNNATTVNVYMR